MGRSTMLFGRFLKKLGGPLVIIHFQLGICHKKNSNHSGRSPIDGKPQMSMCIQICWSVSVKWRPAWWFQATPLKNMTSSVGMMRFPILMGKCQKWQPNHQADTHKMCMIGDGPPWFNADLAIPHWFCCDSWEIPQLMGPSSYPLVN